MPAVIQNKEDTEEWWKEVDREAGKVRWQAGMAGMAVGKQEGWRGMPIYIRHGQAGSAVSPAKRAGPSVGGT